MGASKNTKSHRRLRVPWAPSLPPSPINGASPAVLSSLPPPCPSRCRHIQAPSPSLRPVPARRCCLHHRRHHVATMSLPPSSHTGPPRRRCVPRIGPRRRRIHPLLPLLHRRCHVSTGAAHVRRHWHPTLPAATVTRRMICCRRRRRRILKGSACSRRRDLFARRPLCRRGVALSAIPLIPCKLLATVVRSLLAAPAPLAPFSSRCTFNAATVCIHGLSFSARAHRIRAVYHIH